MTRTSGKYCNLKIKVMNPIKNKKIIEKFINK